MYVCVRHLGVFQGLGRGALCSQPEGTILFYILLSLYPAKYCHREFFPKFKLKIAFGQIKPSSYIDDALRVELALMFV